MRRWTLAGGALLALLVAGGLVIRRERHRGFRELQLPISPLASPEAKRSSGAPVPRGVSPELPPWFGDRRAAPVPISGRVVGARSALTVRLAIDVPDPGIWTGREVAATADGRFDFGPMPQGRYVVLAIGGAEMSRPTAVDTARGPGDQVTLYAASCERISGLIRKITTAPEAGGRDVATPAAGVAVEVAGRVLGTTNAAGQYEVCARTVDDLQLIAPGYESVLWFPRERLVETGIEPGVLRPAYVSSGTVLDVDGRPAGRVGVQPIWRIWSDAPPYQCVDASVVVTTDDDGRFTYSGRHDICGIRVFRGTTIYETTYPFTDAQLGPLPAAPSITPLASLHDEQLIVRLPGGGRRDFERIGAGSLARP